MTAHWIAILTMLGVGLNGGSLRADDVAKPSFADATKGMTKLSGLMEILRDEDRVYVALKPDEFDKPLLFPVAVARGAGAAGMTFNFDEQWILAFRRAGSRVQVVRKNVRYVASAGSPIARAVRQGYQDSVLASIEPKATNGPDDAVLVDLGELLLSNFANLKGGSLDRLKSRWISVKAYPRNIEFEVELTFDGSPVPAGSGVNGDDGFVDSRGVTLVMHYGLVEMPAVGYRPRLADARLGHFVSAVKDFDSPDPDSLFVRRINRWRIEPSDPTAELTPPKRQLVWWIEDTAPIELRPAIESGILEWNKAFERIGIENALAVRWQGPSDEFAPEDVNYCTFRWVASPHGYAMSNLRTNPITGEIVDGDILFDASWVRYWQRERAYFRGEPKSNALAAVPLVAGEPASPLQAARQDLNAVFSRAGNIEAAQFAYCQQAPSLTDQLRFAGAALPGGDLSPRAMAQIVKSVVMHEVGHSLGLRHNFRGSQFRPNAALSAKRFEGKRALTGSVMDYCPLNLASSADEQLDFATTTLGPYDYWAIEYAYKPLPADREKEELRRIAARSTEAKLAYGSDEDYLSAYDPRTNQYDFGREPLDFARRRVKLADEALTAIEDRLIPPGDSWKRLRPAVTTLWQSYGDAAYLACRYVGGRYISHDVRGGENAHEPITPVPAELQRDALKFITDRILVDEPIPYRPALLRRMGSESWTHWGADIRTYDGKIGVPYYEFVVAVQEVAIAELLGSGSRQRLIETNDAFSDHEAISLAEVFLTVNDAVWGPLHDALDHKRAPELSLPRRNLQQLHLRYLKRIATNDIVTESSSISGGHFAGKQTEFTADAHSLAVAHLRQLRRDLRRAIELYGSTINDSSAHCTACLRIVDKSLGRP